MPGLRIPTLQHLARNWRPDPELIAKTLVKLALDPPRFNYNPLYGAVRDLLVFRVPYDQIVAGIGRIPRESVRNNLLAVLPLIRDHFDGVAPDFFQTVERRYYPVRRGLMVPFEPPMIYGVGGQIYFPWFSFWRSNPIAKERLSLFVTLVDEVMLQDPDLENARFEVLDFSCPHPKKARTLTVLDARDVPRLGTAVKNEMLEIFAEGYSRALERLRQSPPPPPPRDQPDLDPDQFDFFR